MSDPEPKRFFYVPVSTVGSFVSRRQISSGDRRSSGKDPKEVKEKNNGGQHTVEAERKEPDKIEEVRKRERRRTDWTTKERSERERTNRQSKSRVRNVKRIVWRKKEKRKGQDGAE